ncbi:cell division protein FtsX [Yoonia litorea]|uniref:Cell division transport system permease protein n=1 Tax=Yoonia litorea TaxID=1123755 RepID=A0A1I6L3R6_9RHOB|nr:cell division protein FtsX [Yoonia litorea]SFR98074.1 cell division transport system permease protein [Yoonia litorea]
MNSVIALIVGDAQADRAVPPTGLTARLTVFVSAAMALLAVIALAISMTTARVADAWADELAQSATLRLPADRGDVDAMLQTALRVLEQTPGITAARALSSDEQQALLEPWFGPDLTLENLPQPQIVTVVAGGAGYDADGLRARLSAEVPGAVFDDHGAWREPLLKAADRIRLIIWGVVILIVTTLAAMVTLAAHASLVANEQVIRVLRLVGARDAYIARAFVRRYTLRALAGATVGAVLGLLILLAMPQDQGRDSILLGVGFAGFEWLWLLVIPLLSGIVAFAATRTAAFGKLKEMT